MLTCVCISEYMFWPLSVPKSGFIFLCFSLVFCRNLSSDAVHVCVCVCIQVMLRKFCFCIILVPTKSSQLIWNLNVVLSIFPRKTFSHSIRVCGMNLCLLSPSADTLIRLVFPIRNILIHIRHFELSMSAKCSFQFVRVLIFERHLCMHLKCINWPSKLVIGLRRDCNNVSSPIEYISRCECVYY